MYSNSSNVFIKQIIVIRYRKTNDFQIITFTHLSSINVKSSRHLSQLTRPKHPTVVNLWVVASSRQWKMLMQQKSASTDNRSNNQTSSSSFSLSLCRLFVKCETPGWESTEKVDKSKIICFSVAGLEKRFFFYLTRIDHWESYSICSKSKTTRFFLMEKKFALSACNIVPTLFSWFFFCHNYGKTKSIKLTKIHTCQLTRLERFSTITRYSVRNGGPYLDAALEFL